MEKEKKILVYMGRKPRSTCYLFITANIYYKMCKCCTHIATNATKTIKAKFVKRYRTLFVVATSITKLTCVYTVMLKDSFVGLC